MQTNCTIFVYMCECCLCVMSDVLCCVLSCVVCVVCVVCVSGRCRMSPRVAFSRNNGFVWLCLRGSELEQSALPTYYITCLFLVLVLLLVLVICDQKQHMKHISLCFAIVTTHSLLVYT